MPEVFRFWCFGCQKEKIFHRQGDVQRHLYTHGLYACNLCDSGFRTRRELYEHSTTVHKYKGLTGPANSQPLDSQPLDSQPLDSQPPDSQPLDSQLLESQLLESQPDVYDFVDNDELQYESAMPTRPTGKLPFISPHKVLLDYEKLGEILPSDKTFLLTLQPQNQPNL
jgi:hypothetical protein